MSKKLVASKGSGSSRHPKAKVKAATKAAGKRRANLARRPVNKDTHDKDLREHVQYVLRGGGAHVDFEKALEGLPRELRGSKPPGVPFTAWTLVEHMRIAQWDILEFSRDAKHVSPAWPEGYWPKTDAPSDDAAWEVSINAFRADLKAMQKLVANPKADLFAPIAHGEGQTLLREALLIADHNAYHCGQLVLLRRLLGAWSE